MDLAWPYCEPADASFATERVLPAVMAVNRFILGVLLIVTRMVVTSSAAGGIEVIDLTYDVTNNSIGSPVHPPYNFTIIQRGDSTNLKVYLEYNKFETGEHRGTHSDAPAHFARGHWRSQQIPPSRLVGPGVIIDVSAKAAHNATYKMTVDDVKAWEQEHDRIPADAIVLMNSGWGRRYPDPYQVYNTTDLSDTSTYVFPSFHPDLGKFLGEERQIIAAGGDVPSPDNRDPAFSNHVALLSKDILVLESVANLDKLPPTGTTIVIGMIKLFDGSGGPSRILALKGVNLGTNGDHRLTPSVTVAVFVSITATSLSFFF